MSREVASVPAMRVQAQPRAGKAVVADLAERQHGVISCWQLERLGFSTSAIGRGADSGWLHRLHPGVYAVGHRAVPQKGRWMAAVLACAQPDRAEGGRGAIDPTRLGAVLSHRSAAALWEIRTGIRASVDVTMAAKGRSPSSIRRHSSQIPVDERIVVDGIPVTSVPRTIFDLAATATTEEVEAMLREVEYRRLYDRLSLSDLLDRYPGRRGSRAVRTALERGSESPGRVETPFEERFLPFIDRYGLPRPHFNAWLEVDGHRYRVDCLWPSQHLVVELDGWEGHRTRAAFRQDRARDRRLRVAGYSVARIAWPQLNDEPNAIAADLQALLATSQSREVASVPG